MVKPVFSNERRDRDFRIEDATTVSRIEDNVDREQPSFETRQDDSHLNMVTRQEAEQMVEQAVTKAIDAALAKKKEREGDGDDPGPVISSKTVKELQNIAGVFTALKEFSSNPLQKAIEVEVGGLAAGVVKKAFNPQQQEPQKKDLWDTVLNSQFAYGLGSGMGQRAPELVETFGKEKVDGWITGAIKGGGGGGGIGGIGGIGGLGGIPGTLPLGTSSGVSPGQKQQSEMELILGLDLNNPEHVAAYAHSQGDMSIDTARRVLRIHQDDFIKQLKLKGVDTNIYEMKRAGDNSSMLSSDIDNPGIINDNVQEYRGPPPRINDELMTNIPTTEDKRWEKEKENETHITNSKMLSYVKSLETQNVELHPEMQRIDPDDIEKEKKDKEIASNSRDEIINYLKSLKDMVEKQGGEMSNLRQEIDLLKVDRVSFDKDVNNNQNTTTTVRSIKTIKKGFNYVKGE